MPKAIAAGLLLPILDPIVLGGDADYGYTPIIVRARNPLSMPIAVTLDQFLQTFRLELEDPSPAGVRVPITWDVFSYDPRAGFFAPGETRLHVFDMFFPKADPSYSPAGVWSARGGFATSWMATPTMCEIRP